VYTRASPTDILARKSARRTKVRGQVGADFGEEVRVGVRVGPVEFKLYNAIASVRPSVSTVTFEPDDLRPWLFALCMGHHNSSSGIEGQGQTDVKVKLQKSRSQFETRSVGLRSSIKDSFLVLSRSIQGPCHTGNLYFECLISKDKSRDCPCVHLRVSPYLNVNFAK